MTRTSKAARAFAGSTLALAIVFIAASASIDVAGAQTIFEGKTGAELRALLREEYTPNRTLDYREARVRMFGVVDNDGGQVELAYTTERFSISAAAPIPNDRGPNGVNTEHTWPRSQFGGARIQGLNSDLHHLFPSRSVVNGARGSKPFADLDDSTETLKWWNGQTAQPTKPSMNADAFSEEGASGFEPEEDHKGNVARAMAYIFTIYEKRPTLRHDFFRPQVPVLRRWNVSDPADDRENERGRRVERIQGNLNPFVADPTLLDRALSDISSPPRPRLAAALAAADAEGAGASRSGVSILAILPNPIGVDRDKESVTLANSSEKDVSLAGWTLMDKHHRVFPLSGVIPAGQTLSVRLAGSAMILSNEGGEVSLIDRDGLRRRIVSYAKSQARAGAFVTFGD